MTAVLCGLLLLPLLCFQHQQESVNICAQRGRRHGPVEVLAVLSRFMATVAEVSCVGWNAG